MSGGTPASGKGKSPKAKKPFWQMELGKKKAADLSEEEVEHPPFVPTLPRVDLLPQAIRQSLGTRKVARSLVVVALLMVLAIGGIWYLQGSRIAEAEVRLAAAQAEARDLQAQVEALSPITSFATALQDQKALVEATMASQPQAAVVIDRLAQSGRDAADGKDIEFATVAITYTGIPPAGRPLNACPNPDPFGTEATIGCLTFSATASDRQEVSRLLEVMAADPLFVGPYVTTTSVSLGEPGGPPSVSFSGTVGVSLEGLKTLLTPEQIEALSKPPEPAAKQEEGESQ